MNELNEQELKEYYLGGKKMDNNLIEEYNNIRKELARLTKEHDLLELETKIRINNLKLKIEEQGCKSTEAKIKAETEYYEDLKKIILIEHDINLVKGARNTYEYKIQKYLTECAKDE